MNQPDVPRRADTSHVAGALRVDGVRLVALGFGVVHASVGSAVHDPVDRGKISADTFKLRDVAIREIQAPRFDSCIAACGHEVGAQHAFAAKDGNFHRRLNFDSGRPSNGNIGLKQ